MCGIAGYIGKERIKEDNINRTLDLMRNRGPDYRDYVTLNSGHLNVVLLHSRLAIIDLDARANQPFMLNDCTLIFNGEIYNYVELRTRLQKKGMRFKTESDTEVLLQSYLVWGEMCVNEFEGMWSFAIYDQREEKFFLSRDRFAEKPLYYSQTPDGFYFASQTQFLRSLSGKDFSINYQHMSRYLVNGYKSLYKTKDTYFKGVEELSHANNLIIDSDLRENIYRYWAPTFSPVKMSLEEAVKGARRHLLESMKIRLRADVPLAFCLSGGVDSAALASIAAKEFNYDVTTFSIIDDDPRYNEVDNINATIEDLNCKHTLIKLSHENTLEKLADLIKYHDAPIATISYLIHSFLSEDISRNGYKVAFSGTSADELFTGYYDHHNLYLYEMRNSPDYPAYLENWKTGTGQFVRNPYLRNPEIYFENTSFRDHIYLNNDEFAGYLRKEFYEPFVETSYCDSLLRNRMMNELFHEITPVILHEDDLNSMCYSVENRSPYLDTALFEFCYSIPTEYLIQNGTAKHILREAVKGILNDKVRTDPRKVGFNASIHSLFDLNKKATRDYLLRDSAIFDYVDRSKMGQVISKKSSENSFSKFLFNFINAKIFLELNG